MLSLQVQSPSQNRLRARWQEAPRVVAAELAAGMERAGEIAVEEVRRAIRATTIRRSGELERRVVVRKRGGGAFLSAAIVAEAPHAGFVNDGTRPHPIRARRGHSLRFEVGGREIYRREVYHPGTRPRRFMELGMALAAPRITYQFRARLGNVTKRLQGL